MHALNQPTLLDANAALRYLLEDDLEQTSVVAEAIDEGAEISVEVIAECVYVLAGAYEVPRSDIAESLGILLEEVFCRRKEVTASALGLYSATKLDFVDCILAAEHDSADRRILTFDKKLIALQGRLDDARQ